MLIGEVYWPGIGSRVAGVGPPSNDEMDMLLPAVLGGLFKGGGGSSRPLGKPAGGPTDTGGARGCGGPYAC